MSLCWCGLLLLLSSGVHETPVADLVPLTWDTLDLKRGNGALPHGSPRLPFRFCPADGSGELLLQEAVGPQRPKQRLPGVHLHINLSIVIFEGCYSLWGVESALGLASASLWPVRSLWVVSVFKNAAVFGFIVAGRRSGTLQMESHCQEWMQHSSSGCSRAIPPPPYQALGTLPIRESYQSCCLTDNLFRSSWRNTVRVL